MSNVSIPKIADLYTDIQAAAQQDQLQYLLNQDPKPDWVKIHPFKKHKYLPIDKIEFLLKRIFKAYKIEVTGQGTAFNGVWVTVRVHYQNPITGEWLYHDGIGAEQLQTKQGSSPADLANLNNGAIGMAFPIAKSLAIKDACDHFGRLFGSDLNRKDLAPHSMDVTLQEKAEEERKRYQLLIENATPEQREKIEKQYSKIQQGS